MVLPIFKTHYSIGKSILTLKPKSKVDKGGADSVIDIALDAGLKEVILIEDTMHGFLEAKRNCEEADLKLIFGIRVNIHQKSKEEDKDKEKNKKPVIETYKVVIMAKNDDGIKQLYKIYSTIHCDHDGKITQENLMKIWDKENLMMVIPFYDSFLYCNTFNYGTNFMLNTDFFKPLFFIESNGLPFDTLFKKEIETYVKTYGCPTQKVKSIYYRNKSDFPAFQTYKMITNRAFGKDLSIQSPNLENCGSDEFCMESWLEL